MNEIITRDSNLAIQRTPNLIAAEINNIKNETKRMVLYNSIEIGRRLIEAKNLIEHGEWGEWLEKSVDYSQRTANNLMRIFEEYGADQITLLGDNAKSQAIANLSYTQAVALLGVPEEERENFITENDVENLSTRELQKIIKEKEKALKEKEMEKEKLETKLKEATDSYEQLEKKNKEYHEKSEKLMKELEISKEKLIEAEKAGDSEEASRIKEELNIAQKELEDSNFKIKQLEKQLEERPIEINAETVVETIPEEIEKELKELREKANKNIEDNKPKIRFSIYFDGLVENFNNLLDTLDEIKDSTDHEEYEKYKNAIKKLTDKIVENL